MTNPTDTEVTVSGSPALPAAAPVKASGKLEYNSFSAPRYLGLVKQAQGSADKLIQQFSLPADAAELQELRLSCGTFRALTEAVAAELNDAHPGLKLAKAMKRGSLGLIEFIARSAPTLREALNELIHYRPLVNELAVMSLDERPEGATFSHAVPGDAAGLGRHGHEFFLAMLVQMGAQVLGRPWELRRVWFANRAPADLAPLRAVFGNAELEFDAGSNGFTFATSYLDAPLASSDPELHALLKAQGERELAARPAVNDFLAQVREKTQLATRQGSPRIERVSRLMCLSSRTLQRRLAEHGTSFQQVLDEVRESLARLYLAHPERALGEVAYMLGYSELRAFVRAFKRWTGTTPGQYRIGLKQQQAQHAS